jgi:uncharacterized SAM-binding protein YcdF (DUF218 family)
MNYQQRIDLEKATSDILEYLAIYDLPAKADIIWGFGSNDLDVPKKAAELYHKNYSDTIVFSGGMGYRWSDLQTSEAEMFKTVAIDNGVPESRIIIENKSAHTGENVSFSLKIIDDAMLIVNSAILITIPPFQLRAMLTVNTQRNTISCLNNPITWGTPNNWDDNRLVFIAKLCQGEVQRLLDYPARGFLSWDPKNLPDNIISSAKLINKNIFELEK